MMLRRTLSGVGRLGAIACLLAVLGCEELGGGGGGGGGGGSGNNDFGDNDPNLIVAFGDSITEGEGLAPADTYPAQLAGLTGRPVINSGVGGEESSEGLGRVSSVLQRHKPGFLLILFGSNDLISGSSSAAIVENLRGIIRAAKANKTVPIVGTIPPAFPYNDDIEGGVEATNPLIRAMAAEEGAAVANVFGALNDVSLYQADGLHPNAAGAGKLASAFAGRL